MEKLIWLAPVLAVIALIFAAIKTIKVSKADAGLFDVMVLSEAAFDNYGAQSILARGDVVEVVR